MKNRKSQIVNRKCGRECVRWMSAVPDESIFTYELTDDNSYLLTWSNFFLNRDTNQPITASIELKRNGDWIATSNETEIVHSRVLPFAHNGFGQDADWVRANFTNAEEILSVGYADWVDAQVGCFSPADFAEDANWGGI